MGAGAGQDHLIDSFVHIANPDSTVKNLRIEEFGTDGVLKGFAELTLAPRATHVFRPKDLVLNGADFFRGSVRVTAADKWNITGAITYEIHESGEATSPIGTLSIYRSMGQ